MNSPDPLRGKVAAQLTAMSVPGGPLHTKSDTSTMIRFAASLTRLRFRRTVIDRYLARETPPDSTLQSVPPAPRARVFNCRWPAQG
ncbi:hypothetical protein CBI38_33815 (plasmid) [Rhodococcus oxybenzonivorans]|uniref:Uncharacterized protein n=1 Tax=Rhodococcus oxybenzonivorans TaxID=1990687 RepID=A0A2S2C6C1_9NOCA|nr:hypothetical protein [Rhodococcus oxybenzonivorans]AWK76392.1 hypothetical protein CBI38_33815 [Rhodococcus oxybenzonivorans]